EKTPSIITQESNKIKVSEICLPCIEQNATKTNNENLENNLSKSLTANSNLDNNLIQDLNNSFKAKQ
ncbi:chromosome segregation protein ParM, partial [Campylobacter upsaliensis]|nr:chromosome segregation protein ParM [Campylobacter upsaliensis]